MRWIIIILLMNIFVIHSQQNESRMLSIKLITCDTNNTIIPRVLIEFPSSKGFTFSSFDGDANLKLCSNQIKDSILPIKVTAVNYIQQEYKFNVFSDTTITLKMTSDSLLNYSKVRYSEYVKSIFEGIEECGTYEYEIRREENNKYIHCDGRIRTFIQIEESGESWVGWTLMSQTHK
jgi:hypothetical protein